MHCSPFNMRQHNLSVMKPPVSKNVSTTFAKNPPQGTSKGPSTTSLNNLPSATIPQAIQSLDLIRQNIQRKINEDIQSVISKYFDTFVKPGIENIRNNLGPDAVTDDQISNMCRQILEDAKCMYPSAYSNSSPAGGSLEHDVKPDIKLLKLPLTSPSVGIKRESDTDSEASCMSNASKKVKKSSNKSNSSATNNSGDGPSGNNKNANSNNSNDSTSPAKPKKPSGPFRKHVAMWDSSKLTIDTFFIMGAKANKALGFAQTRGRLYVKHPGLFKYASDSDDKEWLSKNKLMPATGGRAYIMLLEDIEKLAKDNTLNVTINYEDIKGFKVPDFILEKMKNYIGTWKKTYAEEDEKNAAIQRTRNINSNKQNPSIQQTPQQQQQQQQATIVNNNVQQQQPHPAAGVGNHLNNNMIVTTMASIIVPPPPQPPPSNLPPHQQQQMQQHQQNHVGQQPQSLNNFITGNPSNVLYDPSFSNTQPHEMTEFIHIEKPPPMYPGQQQQQQQQHQIQLNNPGGNFVHQSQLDPIEQAISKGDWSQVSDRSLLQYALQSTRTTSIGSWDPQDSFDLIDGLNVTNGGLGGGGNLGETSPMLQISPNSGAAHLTAPPLGPVSPNCELSAVSNMLDQVSAFQYTET